MEKNNRLRLNCEFLLLCIDVLPIISIFLDKEEDG